MCCWTAARRQRPERPQHHDNEHHGAACGAGARGPPLRPPVPAAPAPGPPPSPAAAPALGGGPGGAGRLLELGLAGLGLVRALGLLGRPAAADKTAAALTGLGGRRCRLHPRRLSQRQSQCEYSHGPRNLVY